MAQIDTGGNKKKRASNVELNVVPFIDLMSCLTAFLLVTAVWTNLAQISTKPKGLNQNQENIPEDTTPPVNASVLLTKNEIWTGLTQGDQRQIINTNEQYNWEELVTVLNEYKELALFENRQDIEIAAEDDVAYEHVIGAMDTAIFSGFSDVGFVDPKSLSVQFKH